jgi:uncharacterized NAD-dependent epimerase/dehydratase family protein
VYRLCLGGLIVGSTVALALGPARAANRRLRQLIQALESLAALARPSTALPPPRVRAVARNTALLGEAAAKNAIAEVSELTGLPCTDPVRYSAGPLLEELLA